MIKMNINKHITEINFRNTAEACNYVVNTMKLMPDDFYLEQNGRRLNDVLENDFPIYVRLRVLGGKGGFGSMLRAIGAQIEKTTNREACRDLSGRRLRDINEEKRLKTWLEKQGEREREAEERKKRKIEKLLAVPKHDFKDEEYEEARSKLTEKVYNALEEGFKNAENNNTKLKRKNDGDALLNIPVKKRRPALWLDESISSSDDTDASDDDSKSLVNESEENNLAAKRIS